MKKTLIKGLLGVALLGVLLNETPHQNRRYFQNNSLESVVEEEISNISIKNKEEKNSAIYHIIQKGDTYYKLAEIYWGTDKESDEIEKLNPGINPNKLKIGQKIRVK